MSFSFVSAAGTQSPWLGGSEMTMSSRVCLAGFEMWCGTLSAHGCSPDVRLHEQRAAVDGQHGAGGKGVGQGEEDRVRLLGRHADAFGRSAKREVGEHPFTSLRREARPEWTGIDDAGGDRVHAYRSKLEGHHLHEPLQTAVHRAGDGA